MKFIEHLKDINEDETNIRPLTRNENGGGIKMTDLFNKSDILTSITADQAEVNCY